MALTQWFYRFLSKTLYGTSSSIGGFTSWMKTIPLGTGIGKGVNFYTTDTNDNGGKILLNTSAYSVTVAQSVSAARVDDVITFTGIYTITNNGASNITIDKIVLATSEASYNGADGLSATSGATRQIDVTTLGDPVVIPAGGAGKITYTITTTPPDDVLVVS